ncbi:DUF2459 domain-containing protein [Hugenholtzia roseola]|uniref:DUF2459 domain-containing protein n=1 Tax=Hugenholtzia roseola TaxID=1002 RepID=UPI0003F8EF44|nr:DUF2459 domain-containing protein [Hugenholtzia roseola]
MWLKIFKYSILTLNLTWVLYALLVGIGILWRTSPAAAPLASDLYVYSNGFHTDLILPKSYFEDTLAKNPDALFFLAAHQDLPQHFAESQYLSIGWGDTGFYMESFNGNFPSFPTCVEAALLPTPTLMHVEFLRGKPLESEQQGQQCRKIKISEAGKKALIHYILNTFAQEANPENGVWFRKGYGKKDFFFQAKGNYHLFQTCNNWTGEALKKAGVSVGIFTPFAFGIFETLPQNGILSD